MKATTVLRDEHETVREAMAVLQRICDLIDDGQQVNPDHLDQLLEFIRVFVDECHHGKEEDLLFPAMEEVGIPGEQGPIGVMLNEHETMRGQIRNFAEAIDDYRTGSESAGTRIVENLRSYLTWLDGHIQKENNILFMLAEAHLPDQKQDELYTAFERLETERIGHDKHAQLHEMLIGLKKTYLPAESEQKQNA